VIRSSLEQNGASLKTRGRHVGRPEVRKEKIRNQMRKPVLIMSRWMFSRTMGPPLLKGRFRWRRSLGEAPPLEGDWAGEAR
jgi:hypothetical protein